MDLLVDAGGGERGVNANCDAAERGGAMGKTRKLRAALSLR